MLPAEQGFASGKALNDTDARLIWELVAKISPAAEILARYGLTVADLQAKKNDRMWAAAYKEALTVWASDMNVQQRIKFKSGLLLEDSLQDLFIMIKDPMMNASVKLEATKQLGQFSQTINPKPSATDGGGAGFKLTINLGDTKGKVTIDGKSIDPSKTISAEALA